MIAALAFASVDFFVQPRTGTSPGEGHDEYNQSLFLLIAGLMTPATFATDADKLATILHQ